MAEDKARKKTYYQEVWQIVRQIPSGRVATYGQVARIHGRCTARMVGYAMAATTDEGHVPWQRVINAQGKISVRAGIGPWLQRHLLEEEGIGFDHEGRVDFEKFGWQGPAGSTEERMVTISEVKAISDEIMQAMEFLIPQLTQNSPAPTREHLQEMIANPNTVLFVAEGEQGIIGFLTLATYAIPTGRVGWIEDVVVDTAARGQGAGEALTRAALEKAERMGCKSVSLTSRPAREAANRLYQRVGFTQPETNFYRYSIKKKY